MVSIYGVNYKSIRTNRCILSIYWWANNFDCSNFQGIKEKGTCRCWFACYNFDTNGLVSLEAAVNGLPTVFFENTCAGELAVNGENGFVFKDDENVWAEQLIKIMKNKEQLKKIGEQAKETISQKWDHVIMQYYDFYSKAIENAKNRE